MSGAPICRVIKKEHTQGQQAATIRCPNADDELAVNNVILYGDTPPLSEVIRCAGNREANMGAEICM